MCKIFKNISIILQIRWINNYNRRIRDEVGPELKRRLKMDAFNWMLKKTATIPEVKLVDEGLLFGHSNSTPSTCKQFHILVYLISLYYILCSKYIKIIKFCSQ